MYFVYVFIYSHVQVPCDTLHMKCALWTKFDLTEWADWDEGVFDLTGIRGCLTWLNGLTGMRGCWPDWDEGVFDLLTKDVEEY